MMTDQAPAAGAAADSPRRKMSLDEGWRFHLGDVPFPPVSGHKDSYLNAKAGTARGAAGMEFNDSSWEKLNVPHDWALHTPIDANNNLSQGFHARGIGWYRRTFLLDESDRGRHFELQFDGIATHCTVWVNGLVAARNWCGYTSFTIDITPFARFGSEINTIAVRVDADAQEGWWYEGAGIYRHMWLVRREAVHIITDGVYANPVRDSAGDWAIPLEVTLGSSAAERATVVVSAKLLNPAGRVVARDQQSAAVDPFDQTVARMTIPVPAPQLWSCDTPVLYTLMTTVERGGQPLDAVVTRVGFRTIRFDAKLRFFLNDQPLKIKGTCNHQDHAGVGVAVPDALWEFRLRRLKEMGSNAYRCAHNPPAAEFLDAADRLGMLVMDENRNFNTTDEYIRQLQWMVRRDRNHPCIILWSVFNEEPIQATEQGYQMVRRLSAVVKQLDTTRPVTAAQSEGELKPINASMAADVAGLNYQQKSYDPYHQMHPDKPLISSEDTSAVMTRGEYITDKERRFVIGSYDDQHQPWGDDHRAAWKMIATRPFVAGGFVWTGFDYRGEPQPLEWPSTGSSFGILDQCGFAKSAYYMHQAQWMQQPVLHLIPHWNWAGHEGEPIKVMAISNAEEVELRLNGQVIGRAKIDPLDVAATWEVPYAAGMIEASAYRNGQEVAHTLVETSGKPAALELVPDRSGLANDGWDAMPVTVRVVDEQGRVVPTACPHVRYEITGAGKILGIGNGNPLCHEPEKAHQRSLYNGLGQVIVQSARGGTDAIVLTAHAPGLRSGTVKIGVVAVRGVDHMES